MDDSPAPVPSPLRWVAEAGSWTRLATDGLLGPEELWPDLVDPLMWGYRVGLRRAPTQSEVVFVRQMLYGFADANGCGVKGWGMKGRVCSATIYMPYLHTGREPINPLVEGVKELYEPELIYRTPRGARRK